MVNSSADEPPLSSKILHSWAKSKAIAFNLFHSPKKDPNDSADTLPQHVGHTQQQGSAPASVVSSESSTHRQDTGLQAPSTVATQREGEESSTIGQQDAPVKDPVHKRFVRDVNKVVRSSWVNWLLIFVPVAIIMGALQDWGGLHIVDPSVIFALCAVAIVPLASLLAFATESVAMRLGDTIGALLNVTFGNAVEIIVFVIALIDKQVRIVQAAALGSILSNLLLIMGMAFVLGGLRFREQVYNPSISQMSSSLLCLSVISLILPTAFHAAFPDTSQADRVVLQVSRGTAVILLIVYVLYLLFQLKSHAFIFESTPQHIVDEEARPGIMASVFNSSSSEDSSSSSDSDSSNNTARRIKRALRRKRRKPSTATSNPTIDEVHSGDEADADVRTQAQASMQTTSQDFETGSSENKTKRYKRYRRDREKRKESITDEKQSVQTSAALEVPKLEVSFAPDVERVTAAPLTPRSSHLRQFSDAIRPAFSSDVFPHHQASGRSLITPGMKRFPSRSPPPPERPRRTSSLPDFRRHRSPVSRGRSPYVGPFIPADQIVDIQAEEVWDPKNHLSRTSSVILLLCTTGLVALCAEFLVGSIDHMVQTSGVSQAFIGLIILPIVGNAAEHVTAVTVAYKNKMDLAINIALGSSIQIALFVTPLMVMLGWAIGAEMSLYFTLFETVSLFASAFITCYLMIDGRTNYLEGTLLIAVYVIIAIAAFFYPD